MDSEILYIDLKHCSDDSYLKIIKLPVIKLDAEADCLYMVSMYFGIKIQ